MKKSKRSDEETERDLPENDGLRPDEQEGPDHSVAAPARCQFKQGERTAGAGESSFEASDELHEAFPIEKIPVVEGADGLPVIITPDPGDTQAVPFTYETQLCIEDDRKYVELWRDELPEDVPARFLQSARTRYDKFGTELQRREFEPADVERRWGVLAAPGDKKHPWLPVRPLRLRCKHYQRQVFSNDSQPDPAEPGHQIVFRMCAARRSNGGAYMSIGNEGIYACDFRDPPDKPTTDLQDAKDKKKLVDRPDLLHLPLFNLEGDAVQLENET